LKDFRNIHMNLYQQTWGYVCIFYIYILCWEWVKAVMFTCN
jgi:hypothetical protein